MLRYGLAPDLPYYKPERESDLFHDVYALVTGLGLQGSDGQRPSVWRDAKNGGVYVGPLDSLTLWERDRMIIAVDYLYCLVMEVPADDNPRGQLVEESNANAS